jgi:hypothetical protein
MLQPPHTGDEEIFDVRFNFPCMSIENFFYQTFMVALGKELPMLPRGREWAPRAEYGESTGARLSPGV